MLSVQTSCHGRASSAWRSPRVLRAGLLTSLRGGEGRSRPRSRPRVLTRVPGAAPSPHLLSIAMHLSMRILHSSICTTIHLLICVLLVSLLTPCHVRPRFMSRLHSSRPLYCVHTHTASRCPATRLLSHLHSRTVYSPFVSCMHLSLSSHLCLSFLPTQTDTHIICNTDYRTATPL